MGVVSCRMTIWWVTKAVDWETDNVSDFLQLFQVLYFNLWSFLYPHVGHHSPSFSIKYCLGRYMICCKSHFIDFSFIYYLSAMVSIWKIIEFWFLLELILGFITFNKGKCVSANTFFDTNLNWIHIIVFFFIITWLYMTDFV